MKLDVSKIVTAHLRTLRTEGNGKLHWVDLAVFYVSPFVAAYILMLYKSHIERDFYLALFTFLGIFIAVSSNIQGNLVSVFHSDRKGSEDKRIDKKMIEDHSAKLMLIKELSNTLSYLNLFTLISMLILLIAISDPNSLFLFKWVSVVIVVHFILTFFMVLKRSHALFQFEFS